MTAPADPGVSRNGDAPSPSNSSLDVSRADVTRGVNDLVAAASRLNRDWKLVDALIRTIADFFEELQGRVYVDNGSAAKPSRDCLDRPPTDPVSTKREVPPVFKARVAAVIDSLSDDEAAWFLKVGLRQVRRRAQQRNLYFFRLGPRRRYPFWQFGNRTILPGAPAVVREIPSDWRPERVHRFMTTFECLDLDGELLTPAEWLFIGEDPSRIIELMQHEVMETTCGGIEG
ncbi:MAG: hypothetical protein ACRDVF_06025 [Microbacterium sp.]|uniref:hypothetical protein n=1 Tax=Microbacterium sp. TaxID=51671 RepID=UPI003D70007F